MSEINLEIEDHVRMSMEEYTKRSTQKSRSDLISEAIAILKIAAHSSDSVPQHCDG